MSYVDKNKLGPLRLVHMHFRFDALFQNWITMHDLCLGKISLTIMVYFCSESVMLTFYCVE